jgi:hypothetical protein
MTEISAPYGPAVSPDLQNVITQRNAQLRAQWLERRLRQDSYPDPLSPQARAWADWYLCARRQEARLWLSNARETQLQQLIQAAGNVIRLRQRAARRKT